MLQSDLLVGARVVIPVAAAATALWAGTVAVRRSRAGDAYTALARPFALLTGCFAVVGVGYAAGRLFTQFGSEPIFLALYVVVVPWVVFTLRYVGRGSVITRRRRLLAWLFALATFLASLVGAVPGRFGLSEASVQPLATAASVTTLGIITVVFALVGLVVLTTYRHDRLSVLAGVVVVLPITELIFGVQTTRPATPRLNDLVIAGVFVVAAATLALGVTRYDVVERLPGTRERGERAALTATDGAVFVLDRAGRVVRANRAATETFGDPDRLDAVTDLTVSELSDRETVSCWTDDGRRQFDPRVAPLSNGYGELLGHTVTLIDVTNREIRRQRLQVLNRILRHNVRNRLDVIRAHAEQAELSPVIDGADRLERLSEEARRVERLMDRSTTAAAATTLEPFLDEIVASVTADTAADPTVSAPDTTVTLDRELCRYAVRNLVENAVEHNDTPDPRVAVRATETGTGVRIVVADDGPGVPAAERAVIEAGTEEPLAHASSLGLWGTNWAVQRMGGSLAFEESDLGGTAVVVSVPDRGRGDDATTGSDQSSPAVTDGESS
ncbi:MAG: ATP-binding protein [Halobaculum sp.]